MKFIWLKLLLICLGFIPVSGKTQHFVEECEGVWFGSMQIYARGVLVDSVAVRLTVTPIPSEENRWVWNTEYLSDKMPMTKAYVLIQQSESTFLLDEGDGVLLTNTVFGNKMYSLFKVDKTWLTASYELLGDTLIFEVTSGQRSKQKSKDAKNYSVDYVQRVVLKKQTADEK